MGRSIVHHASSFSFFLLPDTKPSYKQTTETPITVNDIYIHTPKKFLGRDKGATTCRGPSSISYSSMDAWICTFPPFRRPYTEMTVTLPCCTFTSVFFLAPLHRRTCVCS